MSLLRPEQFDRLRWQAEREHCARDFRYLAESYLRFKAKDAMGRELGRPLLVLNRPQNYLYERMEDQWRRTGFVRQFWGKGRQVGATTLCRGIAFHQTTFHENRNALLVGHDEPSTLAVFAEYDKTWLADLPAPLHPINQGRKGKDIMPSRSAPGKRDAVEFSTIRTRSIANHALNQNVGASQMTHILHYMEASRVTRTADTVWASLQPSLSDAKSGPNGGFLRDHSVGIVESTSRYGGEWFKAVAEQAQAGAFDEWEFVWVPWTMLTAYSRPVPAEFELLPDEREIRRLHPHVTIENLVWRRGIKETYVTNPLDFYQEYPFTWEESWVLPKGVDRLLGHEVCEALRAKDEGRAIRPGVRYEVGQPTRETPSGLVRIMGGRVEVWEPPAEGEFYDLGLDIAGGDSADGDWTVGEVVKRRTLEQVAEFRLHINPASLDLEELVYWLGMAYNAAQINPDATGGWGYSILEALKRRGYPAIYVWRHYDAAQQDLSQRLGYVSTRRSKAMLVNTMVTLLGRGEVTLHSSVLLAPDGRLTQLGELETYLQIGDQWGAKSGAHDDAVSALMLALISARDEYGGTDLYQPPAREAPRPEDERPWAVQDIDAVYDEDERADRMARSGLAVWAEY